MLVNNKYPIFSTAVVHCCADMSISVEIYRKSSYIVVPIYITNCGGSSNCVWGKRLLSCGGMFWDKNLNRWEVEALLP